MVLVPVFIGDCGLCTTHWRYIHKYINDVFVNYVSLTVIDARVRSISAEEAVFMVGGEDDSSVLLGVCEE